MSKRNGQYRYRDATDVQHATVQVKASEFDVKQQYPSVRVNTSQNKTQELTVVHFAGQVLVKRRYHLQDHPCPSCYHSRGGTGKVRSTQGRIQYVRCRVCRHNWQNVIPAEVCMNEKPDPQWSNVAEKMNAVEVAYPAMKPEEQKVVADTLLDALSKITQ